MAGHYLSVYQWFVCLSLTAVLNYAYEHSVIAKCLIDGVSIRHMIGHRMSKLNPFAQRPCLLNKCPMTDCYSPL